jgi:hypothetical protein
MFKKILSRIFKKKIEIGYGLTTDNSVILKKLPEVSVNGSPISKFSIQYELNKDVGLFELLGHRRTPAGKTTIILRNNKTGDTFSLPYNIFILLFRKKPL